MVFAVTAAETGDSFNGGGAVAADAVAAGVVEAGAVAAGVTVGAFASTTGALATSAVRTAGLSVAATDDGEDHRTATSAANATAPPRTRATGAFS